MTVPNHNSSEFQAFDVADGTGCEAGSSSVDEASDFLIGLGEELGGGRKSQQTLHGQSPSDFNMGRGSVGSVKEVGSSDLAMADTFLAELGEELDTKVDSKERFSKCSLVVTRGLIRECY